jgi:hypothetical protein
MTPTEKDSRPLFQLIAAFNRGSLDVPDGFLTPRTTFSLNGRPYESFLGGSADDPLIKLLARGSAGYRTAAKALQYALQHPVVTIESVSTPDPAGLCVAKLRVEGRLLNTGAAFDAQWLLKLLCKDDVLVSADVVCADEDLQNIAKARH